MLPIKHIQSLLRQSFPFVNSMKHYFLFCSPTYCYGLESCWCTSHRNRVSLRAHDIVLPGSVKVFEHGVSKSFQGWKIAPIAIGTLYVHVPNSSLPNNSAVGNTQTETFPQHMCWKDQKAGLCWLKLVWCWSKLLNQDSGGQRKLVDQHGFLVVAGWSGWLKMHAQESCRSMLQHSELKTIPAKGKWTENNIYICTHWN